MTSKNYNWSVRNPKVAIKYVGSAQIQFMVRTNTQIGKELTTIIYWYDLGIKTFT